MLIYVFIFGFMLYYLEKHPKLANTIIKTSGIFLFVFVLNMLITNIDNKNIELENNDENTTQEYIVEEIDYNGIYATIRYKKIDKNGVSYYIDRNNN